MTAERPTSITVIAILQLIFGGLGLLCGVLTLAGQLAGGANMFAGGNAPPGALKAIDPEEIQRQIDERTPAFSRTLGVVEQVVGYGLAVVMIVSGIGLLSLRAWGWWLAVVYGVVSVAAKVAAAIHAVLVVLPVTRAVMEATLEQARRGGLNEQEQAAVNMVATFANIGSGMAFIWPVVSMIYPVLVLIIMFLPDTRKAFRLAARGDAFDEAAAYPADEDRHQD